MLKNKLSQLFQNELLFTPTSCQQELMTKMADFVADSANEHIFLLRGYAGTGKTSSIAAIIKALTKARRKTMLLAPTGRAAKVLSNYTGKSAFTIHKKIYRQKSAKDGLGVFVLDKNLHTDTIFFVDEASMIATGSFEQSVFGTGNLLDDLIEFVYTGKNCKLVLIGDTAQLPPVHFDVSPALDPDKLEFYGLDVIPHELTEVVRQDSESGILSNATEIREMIQENSSDYPQLQVGFKDFVKIKGEELIDEIGECYDRYGKEETMVVTRSNKRANIFNEGIRNRILWQEEEISVGDLLMIVKNNYFWKPDDEDFSFLANGDIVELVRIKSYEELYGHRFANVTVRLPYFKDMELDCKIILDSLKLETAAFTAEDNKKFFYKVLEDYQDLKPKKKQYDSVKENAHFNALQVKFAYGITCHKAQGGQWKAAFIDQGYITEEMLGKSYLRWLYTACTRATEKIYLVNFAKEFISGEEKD